MNILAAFFFIGLLLSGLKTLTIFLWKHLQRFEARESFFIHSTALDTLNQLSFASNETNRRDSNFIRVTSTRESNDRMRRLTQSVKDDRADFKPSENEIYRTSLGTPA